ncbi:MAG: radical SAM protein [bacterium]
MNSGKIKLILSAGMNIAQKNFLDNISLISGLNLFACPNLISIVLTRKCNLRCLQCDFWKLDQYNELSTDCWKKIILDLKNFIGPCFLRFYGGEPFYRKDFLELINFCHRNDTAVLITTNGTLINESVAGELVKNKVFLVNISLDGFKPQTHDRLRGIPGTHNKAMQAIEYLKGKVPVQINTTIMDDNLDEILSLAEFAQKNRIMISFQPYNDRLYKVKTSVHSAGQGFVPRDIKKIDYIIDELCRSKKYNPSIIESGAQLKRIKYFYHGDLTSKKRHCETVGSLLKIRERGEVFLCHYGNRLDAGMIGNLSVSSIRNIWKSSETHNKIRKMRECEATECSVQRGCFKERLIDRIRRFSRCILCS